MTSRALSLKDLLWRVRKIATEAGYSSSSIYASVPLLRPRSEAAPPEKLAQVEPESTTDGPLESDPDGPAHADLVSLVCKESHHPAGPIISPPLALVCLSPIGETVEVRPFISPRGGGAWASRWDDGTEAMTPEERAAFVDLYFARLCDADGPLWTPWSQLSPPVLEDLRVLVGVVMEPSLWTVGKSLCPDFFRLLTDGEPGR